ncbi:MAG: hypothetical protein Q9214_003448 [Letrouitia sp. 1 TL-2023]
MSQLEGIKAKMNQLREEREEAMAKFEQLTSKVKTLEAENLAKEQEITSLTHKNQLLETDAEKFETNLRETKEELSRLRQSGTQNEALQRRLQLLEEEAEESDRNIREVNDKLRQTDVKAGHYERKVQALEAAKELSEEKYEEMSKKYAQVKKELEDFQIEIGNI